MASIPSLENLKRSVRMRQRTDERVSKGWALLSLLPIAVTVLLVGSVVGPLTVEAAPPLGGPLAIAATVAAPAEPSLLGIELSILAYLLWLFSILPFTVFMYKLIKRRTEHLKRHRLLDQDIIDVIGQLAFARGVIVQLDALQRSVRRASLREKDKSAALWALLIMVPPGVIILLYDFYFVMKGFFNHERREELFLEEVAALMTRLRVSVQFPRRSTIVPKRSFMLYFVLSIVTLGGFAIYWTYALIIDPNNHFEFHRQWEDQLLEALEKTTS
ncbi:MAG: hypothetical protein ACE5PO_06335 [Candidatus Bathyarchaeia archaeon]